MSYNLGTATGKIVVDGSAGAKGFAVVETAANAFFAAIQNKLDSVERLGENLIKVGATGSVGLGAAVKAAASFEAGLSAIEAVSGATNKQMEGIRATAMRLGKDTAFSATEAAFAMEALIKAGVSTQDVMTGAADATVNLAAAGGVDLVTAAEIAANALNQFNLEGKDMTSVADLIAGAANASAIDVTDFGFSLSQAGAVANLTGLKFDDLAVAIAEMGQAGIKGSDAGTSIKTFLTNLIPTMDKQKELFRQLGLLTIDSGKAFQFLSSAGLKPASKDFEDIEASLAQYVEAQGGAAVGTAANEKQMQKLGEQLGFMKNAFFDANGEAKSFGEIQEILQNATKNMTREQKLATLETLFGSDAIRAAAVFAEQGAEGYNEMAAAMGKVSAADVAKTRLDNLNGSIEQLKGSFETMMITIGEVFLPLVRRVVDGITSAINVFNNLPHGVQQAIAVFIGLGSAGALLTGILIKMLFVLTPLVAKFLGLTILKQVFSIFTVGFKALRGGQGAMLALAATTGRAGVVFTRFQKIGKILMAVLMRFPKILGILRFAWAAAFGPWGAAIAAVVAAVVIAYKKFEPFKKLVDGIGRSIKEGFVAAVDFAKTAWNAFAEAVKGNGITSDGFIGGIEKAGVIVRMFWEELKKIGTAFKEDVLPVLQEAGRMIWEAMGEAWMEIVNTFQTAVIPAAHDLADTFMNDVFPALKALWTALWPVIKVIGILVAVLVGSLIMGLIQLTKILVKYILPAFIKISAFIITVVVKAIAILIQIIVVIIAFLIKFVDVLIQVVVGAIKLFVAFWIATWNAVRTVFQAIANAIIGAVKAFAGAFMAVWNAIWGVIGPIVKAALELVKVTIQLVLTVILVVITNILGAIYKIWKSVWDNLVKVVTAFANWIRPYVTAVLNAVKAVFSSAWNFIKTATQKAWALIQTYIVTPMRAAYNVLRGVLNSIRSFISGIWNSVRSTTSSIWSGVYQVIAQWIGRILDKIRGIRNSITGAIGNTRNLLVNAGRQIIQGLLDGINAMIGKVRSALQSVTGLIPDWKGPEQRDAKLLTKNGVLIMRSLLDGFRKEIPALRRYLGDVTNMIPGEMQMSVIQNAPTVRRGIGQDRMGSQVVRMPGSSVVNNWNVYNPVAEKTSVTTSREATRRSNLGMV